MVNRPKARGTSAETAVVRAARTRGFPYADRIAQHGNRDTGDATLCPGVLVEVKGGDAARHASDLDIERWLEETAVERDNAGTAWVGFLVVQRGMVGALNAHRWWAWWRLGWVADLGGQTVAPSLAAIPVRCHLGDALTLLRAAGYGTPLDVDTDQVVTR
jgi:hypothetical protein